MKAIDFEVLFPEQQPQILEIAAELQNLILRIIPAAVVTSDEENVGFGYGCGYENLVFVITPHREHVNLGIVKGATLDDPHGLMEGRGKVHKHVKLHRVEQVFEAHLEQLLQSALQAAQKRSLMGS